MGVSRFFLNADFQKGASFFLEGGEHHHLLHVMRHAADDVVEFVNGKGDLARGQIIALDKKKATIRILQTEHEKEATKQLFLATALLRPSKLEWVVEKGTELGASGFVFYRADFSEKIEIMPRHLERFSLLMISSLKQSGRLYLPSIEILSSLDSVLHKEALFLFGDTSTKIKVHSGYKNHRLIFISGPEKGFSPREIALLHKKAQGVSLSAYTLRAETAPIAAASILTTDLSFGSIS
ncbi:MAG TPA: RsmE family RNA methyltransferase [Chlamydiales bacterium]|nr:RsmE family RNA methyltransferase [Chlamydiales bacterium]